MTQIEAAGGVLWRPADTRLGVEVALVHRPGRSSWSLPKGKLRAGEHPILGALREVCEETGHPATVGPALGTSCYRRDGLPKRVQYWSLAAGEGHFTVSKEIDDLVWLPPDAAWRLARGRDQPILERFWHLRPDRLRPLLLVRPASVKARWDGHDAERPLDGRGRRQASALAQLLTAFDVCQAVVADLRRCTETLVPFTAAQPVSRHAVVSLRADKKLSATVERLAVLTQEGAGTVVCAERDLLAQLSRRVLVPRPRTTAASLHRGSAYVLHREASARRRVVATEHLRTAV